MSNSELGVCGKCMKVIFILLNILYMLIALALIGVGSWLIHTNESLDFFTGSEFFSGAALIVTCGIVIFFITALGISGAIFQLRLLLGLYMLIITIVIILEIVAGILGFVYRNKLEDTASNRAIVAIREYRSKDDEQYNNNNNNGAIDFIQVNFKCCGWNTTEIWMESPYFISTGKYPMSCECDNETLATCLYDTITMQSIYNMTCNEEVTNAIRRNVIALGGVGIGFGVIQFLPVALAIGLCVAIHKAKNDYVQV